MTTQTPQIIGADLPFEGGRLWVLNKPAGMPVHPCAVGIDGVVRPDLTTWLAAEPSAPDDLHPAHRLDAGTSGLVLFGDLEARRTLGAWFAEREIRKAYLGLVYGEARAKGVIRRPLQDARRGKKLHAVTRYWRREALGRFALLRMSPETGRKHQLRRHLHAIGHPIIGDERYRSKRNQSVPAFPGRLWLHAWKLTMPDGQTFTAPLPEALERHLAHLRAEFDAPEPSPEPSP